MWVFPDARVHLRHLVGPIIFVVEYLLVEVGARTVSEGGGGRVWTGGIVVLVRKEQGAQGISERTARRWGLP